MIPFLPGLDARRRPVFLFVGAHSDDIEIGCGGTAIALARAWPRAEFAWVVLAAPGPRAAEARRGAAGVLGRKRRVELVLGEFQDGFFPAQHGDLKRFFETRLKRLPKPDLVFTHHGDDRHQDHRVVSELTWNTFRDHAILEYEIPKYDGGLGSPNAFVPLPAATLRRKCAILQRVFATQRSKRWFSAETFTALARLRGIECNAPDGYAEAFHSRKLVLGAGPRLTP